MKILILALTILLTSCGSAQFHINRADKHTSKALSKGATIQNDIDTTVINTFTSDTLTINDTVFVNTVEMIDRVVTVSGAIRYVSRADKRKEYRLEKQNNRLEGRNDRLEARLTSKDQRSKDKTERVTVRNERKKLSNWKNLLIIALLIIIIFLWRKKQNG
jgi:hypothetical protein